ncbi:MAG: hypothetical protein QF408_15255 [Pirellulales bacterium]|jgi:hypothetical protein|nr:hypothetical protein [Pirellulales bacterium]|tara:strand:- start:26 stop:337 length:312 start_codon:yes stop_codon:yes gene_type:complete
MANTKMDIVFDGPLMRGWVYTSGNKCRDPRCSCQSDPSKRHGLYYRWSGTVNGKLMTRSISKEAAVECQRRIANYKAVLKKIDELVNDEIAKEPWKIMGKDPE